MNSLFTSPLAATIATGSAVIWVGLACLLPLVRLHWRGAALWTLVLLGVPVLGWVTFFWGPGFGVLIFAVGLSILVWPPMALFRRKHTHGLSDHPPAALD